MKHAVRINEQAILPRIVDVGPHACRGMRLQFLPASQSTVGSDTLVCKNYMLATACCRSAVGWPQQVTYEVPTLAT